MRIRGNIRKSPGGIDVAFVHDEKWHTLSDSALRTNIEQIYNFLISDEDRATMFGRIYTKTQRENRGNPSTSVKFSGGMCDFLLTKYQKGRDGRPSPSDRASIEMIFKSTANEAVIKEEQDSWS